MIRLQPLGVCCAVPRTTGSDPCFSTHQPASLLKIYLLHTRKCQSRVVALNLLKLSGPFILPALKWKISVVDSCRYFQIFSYTRQGNHQRLTLCSVHRSMCGYWVVRWGSVSSSSFVKNILWTVYCLIYMCFREHIMMPTPMELLKLG